MSTGYKKAFEATIITQDSKIGSLEDLAHMLIESGVVKAFYALRSDQGVFEVETPIDLLLPVAPRALTDFSTLELQAELDRRESAQGLDPVKLQQSQMLLARRAEGLKLVK